MSDFPFLYELQTRWKDMDSFGHVNNSIYLTYIEDARITFFKRWNLCEKTKSIIVASVKIDYSRPINHPSNLIVGQKISRIGSKSFDIESAVFIQNEEESIASILVTCVCFDYAKSVSVPIYQEIIADYNKS